MWGLAVGVLLTTGDQYVVGAVALGTFVLPVSFCVRFADGEKLRGVEPQLMVRLFAGGGLLGFLASAFLEHPMASQPGPVFDGWVGVIEETSKLAALAFMTRNLAEKKWRSGFVLGALVGLGFTAFESAGYAVASALGSGGSSHALIEMVLTRVAVTPFTHGLWTAIAGAALFASSRNGRFRPAPLLLTALVGVAAFHACWDLMPNLADDMESWLAGASSGHGLTLSANLLYDLGQAFLSLPPLYIAYRLRRRRRPGIEQVQVPPLTSPVASAGRIDRLAA